MKVKILESFQTDCRFYRDNVAVGWDLHNDSIISDDNKFHYFKFLTEDKTWDFEPGKRYIFPLWWDSARHHIDEIINFIKTHHDLFAAKTLIPVFLDPLEGDYGIATVIDYVTQATETEVYFINSDYKLKSRQNLFKFLYVDHWQHHVAPQADIIQYQSAANKDYINLNRVARYHRCLLMQRIIDSKLLGNGYNTWANTYDAYEEFDRSYPNNTISKQAYNILDVQDISGENPTLKIPLDYCAKSFVYLVTETHTTDCHLFLSEKTYKPISIGMPFMSLGNPGTLEFLREKGYATFSKWFDESYDNNMPLDKRVDVVVKNLGNFAKLGITKKAIIRQEMKEICQHNLDLYKLLHKKNNFIESLKLIEGMAV